ncbi:MAG: putative ada regulatory of adaptative response protein [Verrucomicrobiales bacterium]|nr:putative ada regulatory of adaptative response protein [Verrucomicrobiales bacterium]
MKSTLQACAVPTREGTFLAYYSDKGLAQLDFPTGKTPKSADLTTPELKRWHKVTTRAIEQVITGKPITELPPLDLSAGTDFQRNVWGALRKISCGKTKSYSEIAISLGKPKGARATGGACGANPIPLLIPCHRVLASGGKLGGFSGGLDWKRKLLRRENVTHYRE